MLLYHGARPNPRAVRMFMLEKGMSIPMRDLDIDKGENREPEFVARNPSGQVPVLELDDGFWLAESGAIFQYLEEIHPEPALIGSTAQERAETRMWQRRVERRITEPLYAAFHYGKGLSMYQERMVVLPECVPSLVKLMHDGMRWLDSVMTERSTIVPQRFTVADIVLYTAVDFGDGVGLGIPEDLNTLRNWRTEISWRPSAKTSLHPRSSETGMRY
ncbi:glutathione S-transferase family protein [Igneacidithiobacillus siniensis]|uniref:glutathione S-transferase family protein n=1 Tax=Acidithiobacillus TaxID=119977 RepID=UPI0020103B6A|nr:glutathione S-transferase family protein [Acidithiobacillus sp. S30A2]